MIVQLINHNWGAYDRLSVTLPDDFEVTFCLKSIDVVEWQVLLPQPLCDFVEYGTHKLALASHNFVEYGSLCTHFLKDMNCTALVGDD